MVCFLDSLFLSLLVFFVSVLDCVCFSFVCLLTVIWPIILYGSKPVWYLFGDGEATLHTVFEYKDQGGSLFGELDAFGLSFETVLRGQCCNFWLSKNPIGFCVCGGVLLPFSWFRITLCTFGCVFFGFIVLLVR